MTALSSTAIGGWLAGGGVRSLGGLTRNCLIRDNVTTGPRGYGGGVGVSGSGVILNCTIAANTADTSAGGVSSVKVAGGTVTNCIVYGNTCVAARIDYQMSPLSSRSRCGNSIDT